MLSLIMGILAIICATIGLQIVAERLDFSQAVAGPAHRDDNGGGNGRGGS